MANYRFSNANGGYWQIASNWSPAGVPGVDDEVIDAGYQILVVQNETAATLTLSGGSEVDIYSGTLTISTTLTMTAQDAVVLHGGMLDLGGAQTASSRAYVTYSGFAELRLEEAGGAAVDNPTILDFAKGDTIDLAGIGNGVGSAVLDGTVLDVTLDPGTASAASVTIQMDASVAGMSFIVRSDGGTGSLVQVACYCRDTLILTAHGDRPVEALALGDTVVTASGQHRPVRWIGRRSYAGRFLAANPGVQPVRFRAGALGGGLPRRDLLVSPEHAMFVDGVLVPARCLVNGTTIVQERGLVGQVDYFHVELDSHDVLLAEGAPSESFVDDDSRGMFHNAAEWAATYPGRRRVPAAFCAPRVERGPELEAIRGRLGALAGASQAA